MNVIGDKNEIGLRMVIVNTTLVDVIDRYSTLLITGGSGLHAMIQLYSIIT